MNLNQQRATEYLDLAGYCTRCRALVYLPATTSLFPKPSTPTRLPKLPKHLGCEGWLIPAATAVRRGLLDPDDLELWRLRITPRPVQQHRK